MEARETIRQAIDYMDEHGWCTMRLTNEAGNVCAVGALMAVTATDRHDWVDDDTQKRVGAPLKLLANHIPGEGLRPRDFIQAWVDVVHYNNEAGRSYDNDIRPWFEKAAADETLGE